MNLRNLEIAKNFAVAFLNVFNNKISQKDLFNIITLIKFLKQNPLVVNIFSLPNIPLSDRNNSIDLLLNKFDLPLEFKKLFFLLLETNRIYLLLEVLKKIVSMYQEKNSIVLFEITSANLLNESDLEIIKRFLERKTNKKVIESYTIDKNLIAGIRAQSDTFLWEFSISKQLRNLKLINYGFINGN